MAYYKLDLRLKIVPDDEGGEEGVVETYPNLRMYFRIDKLERAKSVTEAVTAYANTLNRVLRVEDIEKISEAVSEFLTTRFVQS